MKKKLLEKFIGTALCSLTGLSLFAQTPISSDKIAPKPGEKNIINNASYVNPGSAGLNQTWDLSKMNYASQLEFVTKTPSEAGLSAAFKDANVLYYNPNSSFVFKSSNNLLQTVGFSTGGLDVVYTDYEDFLKFPLTYNDNHSDNWSVTMNYQNAMIITRTGTTTVKVDGYGKLITPDGVFENAYRVNTHQVYTDVYSMNGSQVSSSTIDNNQYSWFVEGIHYPVAQIYDMNAAGQNTKTGSYINYYKSETESISLKDIQIFPNPVNSILKINSNAGNEVSLTDITGKVVLKKEISNEFTNEILVNELKSGLYIVTISEKDQIISQNKLTIE